MKLLLAEDERDLSEALVAILNRNHFTVDPVYDGQEALDYLEVQEYDGVILDIMMPKVDGLTVLKTIREQGNDVPVLMLTAKSGLDDRVFGLDCGADDYLGKPFATKELLARLRAITRRKSDAVSAVLQFGNITLDTARFELASPKGKVKLQNKEFQMLEMLIANPKQIISTNRFFEKIWGYDSEAELNVVWVYISYLRKKLATLDANIQIKATRNQGYSLEELA
ncbi:MAG: response regulator transcription factor [Eubacterium sp.]|nr:response regulator transcription factor [Eubacterium sp.]